MTERWGTRQLRKKTESLHKKGHNVDRSERLGMSWNQYQNIPRRYGESDLTTTINNTKNNNTITADYSSNLPYVDSIYNPASVPTTPAPSQHSYWPTPSLESRLNNTPNHPQFPPTIRRAATSFQESDGTQSRGLGLYPMTNTPKKIRSARKPKDPKSTPTHKLSERTLSSPATYHTPQSATSPPNYPAPGNLYTPPLSVEQYGTPRPRIPTPQSVAMTQRRLSSHGQRPIMGPPETPSRGMIPQSPGLFPNIQFSPDLFSQQMMEAQAAPIYPQQRLFWDPSTATPLQNTPQNFHTPTAFPDDFSNSFNSNSTIVPPNFNVSHSMPYDLPNVSEAMDTNFMDGSVFPAPFQASPRLAVPQPEDPTHFLSSPARRFGGEPQHNQQNTRRAIPDLPAYHHQMQESKREKELIARGRRKSKVSKRSSEDLVTKSVRRALSPAKGIRPALSRSVTYSGLQLSARRSFSTLDNMSLDSSASSRSIRAGRSSPIRQTRDSTRRSSASARLRRVSSSVSLAIDEYGVARTVMNPLPEDDDTTMNDDENLTDRISSDDEFDDSILYSFSGDTDSVHESLPTLSRGDARDELRSHAFLSMGMDRVARVSKITQPLDPRLGNFDPASTIRRPRTDTFASTNPDTNGPVSAQQALRQMMQDRSRSASSHASTSSMQFHSSPPMQAGQLPGFHGSPTTVTDPDLATPSTDADSLGSSGATRCVCNSISPDGNIMIQW